jgi:hypothetical protein
MWCWRRVGKTTWTDRVRNEEMLQRVKEDRNILHIVKIRKANWIGHIWRRSCLQQQVIGEMIEVQRSNWLGHVERMTEDKMCRRLRYGNPCLKDQLEDLKHVGKMTFCKIKRS